MQSKTGHDHENRPSGGAFLRLPAWLRGVMERDPAHGTRVVRLGEPADDIGGSVPGGRSFDTGASCRRRR